MPFDPEETPAAQIELPLASAEVYPRRQPMPEHKYLSFHLRRLSVEA